MPSCELNVVLCPPVSRGDGRVHPGETISGRVVVRLTEATNLNALTIQTVLMTRISKTPETIPGKSATLFTGSLPAGEHVYPFTLPAPSLPFEYMGEDASFFWRVAAHADVPWGADVEAAQEIQLRPREGTRWKLQPKATGDRQAVHDTKSMIQETSACGCVAVGVFGLLAGVALLSLALAFEPKPEEKTALIVLGVIAFIAGVVSVVLSRWRGSPQDLAREANQKVAAQRIGAPQLAVELEKPAGYREAHEDALVCSLWVKPDAPPLEIQATLEAEVSWLVFAEGGARSKMERRTRTLHSATSSLTASAPGEYRGRLALPAPGAVPTPMLLPNGKVEWHLRGVVRCAEIGWSHRVEIPLAPRPDPGPGFDEEGVVA